MNYFLPDLQAANIDDIPERCQQYAFNLQNFTKENNMDLINGLLVKNGYNDVMASPVNEIRENYWNYTALICTQITLATLMLILLVYIAVKYGIM
jgi:hypothetical protein